MANRLQKQMGKTDKVVKVRAQSQTSLRESSSLLKEWRRLSRRPSGGPTIVDEKGEAKIQVRVDPQTSEWILDITFPIGGPKPKIIDSLKFVRVEEAHTKSVPRLRILSIRYIPSNDCVEYWPHFAEAIVESVLATPKKTHWAQAVSKTLKVWGKIWPGKKKGLGAAELAGMFAELFFLKTLSGKMSPKVAINAWHGPFSRDHDFTMQRTGFEVKASTKRRNTVVISNLDQLNDEGLDALYLAHICLRKEDGNELSLQKLGDDIHSGLSSELQAEFKRRLAKAGWIKATESQRKTTCYRCSGQNLYKVEDGFPRILKKELIPKFGRGVDVKKYTVDLDASPTSPLGRPEVTKIWDALKAIGDHQLPLCH